MAKPKQGGRARTKRHADAEGIAYIQATFNNTIVTITDMEGNASGVGQRREGGLQRIQEVHSIRRHGGR